jgi:uncharacterized protein (TIGR00369 family)
MHHDIPAGFEPAQFRMQVPFIDLVGPVYMRLSDGGCDIGARVEQRHRNGGRIAHGGFLMTLADIATARAAALLLPDDRANLHVNISMDFYAAAPLGSWVEARARVERQGKSMTFCNCDFFVDGAKVGHATAVLKSIAFRPRAPVDA